MRYKVFFKDATSTIVEDDKSIDEFFIEFNTATVNDNSPCQMTYLLIGGKLIHKHNVNYIERA